MTAADALDPRAAAPRDPAPVGPPPPVGGFRRTTHVAAGPAPGHDWGAGVDVPRVLHAACRDRALGDDGGHEDVDVARLEATTDARLALTSLEVSPGPTPEGLLGLACAPGLRAAVAGAVDDTTSATAAALLDLGIGGNLSGYARLQASREAGLTTSQALAGGRRDTGRTGGAIERMAGSCRGWARDGDLVAVLRAGTDRPPQRPPLVDGPDLDGWHDLGSLAAGWVRRRRRIDVHAPTQAGRRVVVAAFRDSWVDPEGRQRSLHEWELSLELDGDDVVRTATGTPRSLPFGACPLVVDQLPALHGTPVAGLREMSRAVLGSEAGCTHLDDLLSTVPAAVAAAERSRR